MRLSTFAAGSGTKHAAAVVRRGSAPGVGLCRGSAIPSVSPSRPPCDYADSSFVDIDDLSTPSTDRPTSHLSPEQFMKEYRPDMHISRQESIPSFVMVAISSHIAKVCAAHKLRFLPGSSPMINQLFGVLFEYMAQAIKYLNECIAAGFPPRFNLFRIADLLSVEVSCTTSPSYRLQLY